MLGLFTRSRDFFLNSGERDSILLYPASLQHEQVHPYLQTYPFKNLLVNSRFPS